MLQQGDTKKRKRQPQLTCTRGDSCSSRPSSSSSSSSRSNNSRSDNSSDSSKKTHRLTWTSGKWWLACTRSKSSPPRTNSMTMYSVSLVSTISCREKKAKHVPFSIPASKAKTYTSSSSSSGSSSSNSSSGSSSSGSSSSTDLEPNDVGVIEEPQYDHLASQQLALVSVNLALVDHLNGKLLLRLHVHSPVHHAKLPCSSSGSSSSTTGMQRHTWATLQRPKPLRTV
ncbi:hypothetical protein Emed_003449 [Eimeria media]